MRFILKIAVCLVGFLVGSRSALPADEASLANATVLIYATSDQSVQVGTGFFINAAGDIATAYHVIYGAKSLQIISHQGSFATYTIKSFDSERDLAVITVKSISGLPFKFIPVQSPPDDLAGKAGLVIGNPDMKKDFAIHVTFPRGRPIASGEWSTSGLGTGGNRWIFSKSDVKLIAVDGTLNHGMSGGPVIVDGKAIGVFSGGEEQSGGGLGWAISSEYLMSMRPSPTVTDLAKLPPLALLAPNSAKPALLKAVVSPFGLQAYPIIASQQRQRSNVSALGAMVEEVSPNFSDCKAFYESTAGGRGRAYPTKDTDEYRCLLVLLASARLMVQSSLAVNELMKQSESSYKQLYPMWEKRVSLSSSLDIKQGLLRGVDQIVDVCKVDPALQQLVSETGRIVGDAFKPMEKLPTFPPTDIAANSSLEQKAKLTFDYLQHDYGRTLIASMSDGMPALPRWIDAIVKLTGVMLNCSETVAKAIDFQSDLKRRDEHLNASDLRPNEQAYFVGMYLGFYQGVLVIAQECQSKFGRSDDIDKALFRFKQKHLLYTQSLDTIGPQAFGASDYVDLKNYVTQTARPQAKAMLNELAAKGVEAEFCATLPAYIDKRNIENMFPDTAEALSGREVDRSKTSDIMAETEKAFGELFARLFVLSPQNGAKVGAQLFPNFFRVMVRTWMSNLLLQCTNIASPLPPAVSDTLQKLSSQNQSELTAERKKIENMAANAVGSSLNMDQTWRSVELMANKMNEEYMKEFGIQSSGSLASACIQLIRPDVQKLIADGIPSDAEFGAKFKKIQELN
ncbi:Trypsin-like peptidase domain [Paraburkholderia caribensis MBA4]|uniref:Trypsin-like peptidase domain n=1 Tax=Paraburkholderia caribensis MBA4 TaxID=1323664 RepID=A0A0P0RIC6_9BURK|nr:serine protease [Paraburkholderia caribensis]ALL68370.1 Trypsin-like peptidase domain [Paraburkholderia caribensis MBA4]